MKNLDIGTHSTKMGADKLAKNTPNAPKCICPIFCPSPKVWDFDEKRLHRASVVCVHNQSLAVWGASKMQCKKIQKWQYMLWSFKFRHTKIGRFWGKLKKNRFTKNCNSAKPTKVAIFSKNKLFHKWFIWKISKLLVKKLPFFLFQNASTSYRLQKLLLKIQI